MHRKKVTRHTVISIVYRNCNWVEMLRAKFTSTLLRNGYLIFDLAGIRRGAAPGLLWLMRLRSTMTGCWNEIEMEYIGTELLTLSRGVGWRRGKYDGPPNYDQLGGINRRSAGADLAWFLNWWWIEMESICVAFVVSIAEKSGLLASSSVCCTMYMIVLLNILKYTATAGKFCESKHV